MPEVVIAAPGPSIPQTTEERGETMPESQNQVMAQVILVIDPPAADLHCDRCGAQGYVDVELLSGTRMSFCAHHYRENEGGLIPKARRIRDHRPHLNQKETKAKAQTP